MPRRPKPMEAHAIEGTKSEVGRARVAGTRRRAKPPAGQPAQPTARIQVAGRSGFTAPKDLDADCRAAWDQLRCECATVLDAADAAMLESAAVYLGRFRQARRGVQKFGLTIEVEKVGRQGMEFTDIVPNPALKLEREYGLMLHRSMIELGIGPSARARFSGSGVEGMQASEALNGVADLVAIRGGRA